MKWNEGLLDELAEQRKQKGGIKKMSEKESMVLKAAKEEMSTEQREMFDQEYEKSSISMLATYLLWFLFGFIGIHKFYVRKTGMGVLYIFTGGLFVIGLLLYPVLFPN